MDNKLKEKIRKLERYQNFTLLDKPVAFKDMYKGRDIKCVQLHCIQEAGDDIVGFCGAFQWKDGKVISLDGDTYSPDTLVYGINWWKNKETGREGLDILVGDDW